MLKSIITAIFIPQADLKSASEVLAWNKKILSIIGLWPGRNNDFRCVLAALYMFVQCCAGFAELQRSISYADTLETVTEMVVFSMILIKLPVFRIRSRLLSDLINDIKRDFSPENYNTKGDCSKFIKYNVMSKLFIKVALYVWVVSAIFYYLRPVIIYYCERSSPNTTLMPTLPYRFRFLYEITDTKTYIAVYLYEIFVPVIAISGFIGTDFLLVTLIFHLCGQYAALAHQISHSVGVSSDCRFLFSRLVLKHQRLIRATEAVNKSFGILLLCQLLSISCLLCFIWYNMIYLWNSIESTSSGEQYTMVMGLAMFQNVMLVSLFGYCFIGECLSHESIRIAETLCMCEWYRISPCNLKYFHICLSRAQYPAVLSAAKFFVFSFISFTRILKTSMAYLSFLRNLL